MVFGKKKEMIELSEVQKRSLNLPHGKAFVPKDGYGFVDLTKKRKLPSELRAEKALNVSSLKPSQPSSESSFSFFDSQPSTTTSQSFVADESTQELLRKISMQISDLDTKMYKLEQRTELLERKTGISNSDSSTSGGFNW